MPDKQSHGEPQTPSIIPILSHNPSKTLYIHFSPNLVVVDQAMFNGAMFFPRTTQYIRIIQTVPGLSQ